MVKITGKFAIERAAPGNTGSYWPPTWTNLRGRWDNLETHMSNAIPEYWKLLKEFQYLQGQCVEIDVDARAMRIYDPYGEPENKDRLERLIQLNNAIAVALIQKGKPDDFKPINGVEKPLVVVNASDDQLKEWLFCARRWLDKGKAVEVKGVGLSSLPSMKEITAMPGKIREVFLPESVVENTVKYIHDVPVGA